MIDISFEISGVEQDRLEAFAVDGIEELSTLFHFDVMCLSPVSRDAIGPDCLGSSATLVMTPTGAPARKIQGIITDVSVAQSGLNDQLVYQFRLAPALSQLGLSRHNRIYGTLGQITAVDILQSMLQGTLQRDSRADDSAAAAIDHDFRFRGSYPQFDHITQYEETDLAFLSRLTEHWGIYFFFEHHDGSDLAIFADDPVFAPLLDPEKLRFDPSALGGPDQSNTIQRFEACHRQVANRVFLQDYNELRPQVPLLVSAEIDPRGRGYVVEYGDHYRTQEEGNFLARVRAEELRSVKTRFRGRSNAPSLAPGYCFDLSGHDVRGWDDRYFTVAVKHYLRRPVFGTAASAILAALDSNGLQAVDAGAQGYRNEFTAMKLSEKAPFRPQRRTPRPHIDGLLNGRIETSLDNRHPHLDENGRYRVRLPFDLGTAPDGKGSRWIPMAEPYGGPSNGMHFPLPPGTEVIVACINGDPDRPVIVGAVPSANTPSVVNAATSHLNRIQTRSGITITMADYTK